MAEDDGTSENPSPDSPLSTANNEAEHTRLHCVGGLRLGQPPGGGEKLFALCHADRMTKKQTKRTMLRSTDWNVGQPLVFPQLHAGIKSLAREAVDGAHEWPVQLQATKT